MQTARKRIRRDYAPLNVAVSLVCGSSGSPLMQVYNAWEATPTYEPDRTKTATMLVPVIHANTADGSMTAALTHRDLADIKWFVNGENITTVSDWAGKYTLYSGDDEDRGKLAIWRNVKVDEIFTFHMEATIYDKRMGLSIPIVTDEITISTTDQSEDSYAISLEGAQSMTYNPFVDNLLIYDYKVSQGIITASAKAKKEATDDKAYLRTIPIHVFRGTERCTDESLQLKLYWVDGLDSDGNAMLTEIVDGAQNELVSLHYNEEGYDDALVLDLRVVEDANYMLKAFASGKLMAQKQFTVRRSYPAYYVEPMNDACVLPTDKTHYNKALVSSNGKTVDYPAAILQMVWRTDSATKTALKHNEGETVAINLAEAGVGNTYEDDWLDVYLETKQRAYAFATATNADGTEVIYTDEKGNELIFC